MNLRAINERSEHAQFFSAFNVENLSKCEMCMHWYIDPICHIQSQLSLQMDKQYITSDINRN